MGTPIFTLDLQPRHFYNSPCLSAEIAQPVEQGTENPRVPSSILGLGTRKIKGLRHFHRKPFFLLSHFVHNLSIKNERKAACTFWYIVK